MLSSGEKSLIDTNYLDGEQKMNITALLILEI